LDFLIILGEASTEDSVEVRLIFSEKRDLETNEKPVETNQKQVNAAKKKPGRKKKNAKDENNSMGNPRGREALEEFRQKCGLDLTEERISSLRSVTQIPLEHNYFVHENAKLLKIKLTQAQVGVSYKKLRPLTNLARKDISILLMSSFLVSHLSCSTENELFVFSK